MAYLGKDSETEEMIRLLPQARRQGVYVIGTPGTGKTTLLQNIAVQDMEAGEGLCVLDPHGDLTDELLARVPPNRREDVIVFDPVDLQRPFGLNLLECDPDNPHEVRWVVSTVMGTLHRLFFYSWGPRLEHVLRHSLLTAMTLPEATLVELLLLLTSESYREGVVAELSDPLLVNFWDTFPRSPTLQYELTSSTLNKISPFLTDRAMRNIVGQVSSSFDMQAVMDEGKILLVNLSKGDLGEDNSALLGSVLVNLMLIGALRRRSIPYRQRRPFHLIVDEFQNFASESFAVLQSEARKYAVDVIVAHQYRDQLDELNRGSTLNVANFVVLRVSGRDSHELASQFDNTPPPPDYRMEPLYRSYDSGRENIELFERVAGNVVQQVEQPRRAYSDVESETANTLSMLPNFEARCRLVAGRALKECRIETCDVMGEADEAAARDLREQSRQRYGCDRAQVEADLMGRISQVGGEPPLIPAFERSGVGRSDKVKR